MSYVDNVIEQVKEKNPNEPEFIQAVTEVLTSLKPVIESNPAYSGSGLSVYTITFTICSSELKKYKTHHQIIEALQSLDYIYHIEEIR